MTITNTFGENIWDSEENYVSVSLIMHEQNYMAFLDGKINLANRLYFLVPLGLNVQIFKKPTLQSSVYHHYLAFASVDHRLDYLSVTGFNVKIHLNRVKNWLFPLSESGDILFYFFKSVVELGGDYLNSKGIEVFDTFSVFFNLKFIITKRFNSGLGIRYFTFENGVVQSSFFTGLSYKNFSLTPEIRFLNKDLESPFEPVYPFRYRVYRISIMYSF